MLQVVWLDGSGNGSFPGPQNPFPDAPALDHASDRDVFQVHAASDRPMTITVGGLDTFLRIYDASGRSIATDHNSFNKFPVSENLKDIPSSLDIRLKRFKWILQTVINNRFRR